MMRTRQVAHIADITTETGYAEGSRPLMDLVDLGRARALVAVPMLKDNELVGSIVIYRQEVRPFTEKQMQSLDLRPPGWDALAEVSKDYPAIANSIFLEAGL